MGFAGNAEPNFIVPTLIANSVPGQGKKVRRSVSLFTPFHRFMKSGINSQSRLANFRIWTSLLEKKRLMLVETMPLTIRFAMGSLIIGTIWKNFGSDVFISIFGLILKSITVMKSLFLCQILLTE